MGHSLRISGVPAPGPSFIQIGCWYWPMPKIFSFLSGDSNGRWHVVSSWDGTDSRASICSELHFGSTGRCDCAHTPLTAAYRRAVYQEFSARGDHSFDLTVGDWGFLFPDLDTDCEEAISIESPILSPHLAASLWLDTERTYPQAQSTESPHRNGITRRFPCFTNICWSRAGLFRVVSRSSSETWCWELS